MMNNNDIFSFNFKSDKKWYSETLKTCATPFFEMLFKKRQSQVFKKQSLTLLNILILIMPAHWSTTNPDGEAGIR